MGNFLFSLAKIAVGMAVIYYGIGFLDRHTFILFLLVAAYFAYGSAMVYTASSNETVAFKKMDIRGKFIDPILHQLNIFEWSDLSHVTRAQQGTTDTQVWQLDEINNRYIVNMSTTVVNYATYNSTTGVITIKSSTGQVLTTLNRISPDVIISSTSCSACATAATGYPTYANFAQHFQLVHLNPSEQPLFAGRLDVLRACAMFHIDTIPIGASSNQIIANGAFAVAKDNTCFFLVPPTQYTFLLGNGIVDLEIALENLPNAFCGSM